MIATVHRTLACFIIALFPLITALPADATTVFEAFGTITLTDGSSPAGTRVTLKIDLNRDGKFAKYETVSATANAGGGYELDIDLDPTKVDWDLVVAVTEILADFADGGFDALITGGPLSVVLSYEKEGYSKVVHTLSTNNINIDFSPQ